MPVFFSFQRLRLVAGVLRRPELLAFLPAIFLAASWFGSKSWLLVTALMVPLAYGLSGVLAAPRARMAGTTGIRRRAEELAENALHIAEDAGQQVVCLVVVLDDCAELARRHGPEVMEHLSTAINARFQNILRGQDRLHRLSEDRIMLVIGPQPRLELDDLLQIAGRLQAVAAVPINYHAETFYISASVGFCLASRAPARSGAALLAAAETAATIAWRNGPSGLRAYSHGMGAVHCKAEESREELENAMEKGEVRAYFQPQIDSVSGDVIGFEALSRWLHPTRGLIPPAEFLPAIHAAGLSQRLGEVMVAQAFGALAAWDAKGWPVPQVAVNFSSHELRNPRLATQVQWEMDRFDLAPQRLVVEVLETVLAESDDDITVQNVRRLARIGCGIDLDDFGTGHAAISAIRRFSVNRLKIDRSFVTGIDHMPDQQRIVAAILSMARELGLAVLAEGVETRQEVGQLASMGCTALQGFAIGPPMSLDDSFLWLENRGGKSGRGVRFAASA